MKKHLILFISLIFFSNELNHLYATPTGTVAPVVIIQGSSKASMFRTIIVVGSLLVSGYFVYSHFFASHASAQDVKRVDNRVKHLQKQVQEVDDNTQKLFLTANEMCVEINANGMEIIKTREEIQKQIQDTQKEIQKIDSDTQQLMATTDKMSNDLSANTTQIIKTREEIQSRIKTLEKKQTDEHTNLSSEIKKTQSDLTSQIQKTVDEITSNVIGAYEAKILNVEAKILEAQKAIEQKIIELETKQKSEHTNLKEKIAAEIAQLKGRLEELSLHLQVLNDNNDQVVKRLTHLENGQQEIVSGISGLRELLLINASKVSENASSSQTNTNWLSTLTGLFGSEGGVKTDNVMDLTVKK